MKVFISWSGERSQLIAQAIRDWLPDVIQALEPWMSAEDIDKGARWSSDVAKQLNDARIGVICLTPENLQSPWILFETGALSKTLEKTFVCPYILDLEPAELTGPFVQFQATKANKRDTRKLLFTVNKALEDDALTQDRLNASFERCWPDFDEKLKHISALNIGKQDSYQSRSEKDIANETLELVRNIARALGQEPILSGASDNEVLTVIRKDWKQIIEDTKSKKIHLGSFLNEGEPISVINGVLEVRFGRGGGFHKNTVETNKNLIEAIIAQVTGYKVELVCTKEN